MGELRVGLVGCGYIAPTHLLAWEKVEGAKVVAVCDASVQRAEKLASHFEIPATYTEYRDMFLKERLDIVDIASALESHAEIATAAARNRLHVLCQKPLAPSMAEARTIVSTCQDAGVKLMVHQNFRFQPFPQHLKKMMNSSALGEVFYCRIFHRLLFRVGALPVAARGAKEPIFEHEPSYLQNEHLVLMNMVIHHLDTARFLFGEPESLYASSRRFGLGTKGEDHVLILLEYDDKVCFIEESWVTRGEELIGFRIEGDKGSVEITNEEFRHCKADGSCERGSLSAMFPGFTMRNIDNYSFRAVQQHFVDCIVSNQVPLTSGDDNLRTLGLVFNAYKSAQTRQAVRLDWEK